MATKEHGCSQVLVMHILAREALTEDTFLTRGIGGLSHSFSEEVVVLK
jgi:hypothetical protein